MSKKENLVERLNIDHGDGLFFTHINVFISRIKEIREDQKEERIGSKIQLILKSLYNV